MPRAAKHNVTKWVRRGSLPTNVLTHAGTSTSAVFALVPPVVSDEVVADWTCRRIRGSISLIRLTSGNATQAISYMIYKQQTNPVNGEPLTVLNPLSSDPVLLGNRDILDWGQLEYPKLDLYWNTTTEARVYDENHSITVTPFDVKVNRKLGRLAHGIFMVIVGDSSSDFKYRVQSSALLSS